MVSWRENRRSTGGVAANSDPFLREFVNFLEDESPVMHTAISSNSRVLPPKLESPASTVSLSLKRPFNSNGTSFSDCPLSKRLKNLTASSEISLSNSRRIAESASGYHFGSSCHVKNSNSNKGFSRRDHQVKQEKEETKEQLIWPSIRQFREAQSSEFGRGNEADHFVKQEPQSFGYGRSASSDSCDKPIGLSHHMGVSEESREEVDESTLFEAALKSLNDFALEVNPPMGVLSVPLFRHQKIALAWMLEKEKGGVCTGGFLADDQGLGKTISMIALIQMQRSAQEEFQSGKVFPFVKPQALKSENKNAVSGPVLLKPKVEATNLEDGNVVKGPVLLKPKVESDNVEDIPALRSNPRNKFYNKKPAAGTLIVCPASLLRQWARELDEKVTHESKLAVLIYHGSKRTKDPVELAEYDVVLTTYAIVSMEVPKLPLVEKEVEKDQSNEENSEPSSEFCHGKGVKENKGTGFDDSDCGTLAKVLWFRVILDEAHIIKNHRTKVARASSGLGAKRRWCLSGTPIQNAIEDLFSYFRFLKHDPYGDHKKFVHGIVEPLFKNSNHGYKKLQFVLKAIMLRRTKGTLIDGKPILCLPPKTIKLSQVTFSGQEWAFYDELEEKYRAAFRFYDDEDTVEENYELIMAMLLKLRQACDHPVLIKRKGSGFAGSESWKTAKNLSEHAVKSLLQLLETPSAVCGVCNHPPENAVVTLCGHVFCHECVSNCMIEEETICPEDGCKAQVTADGVFSRTTLEKCLSELGIQPSGPPGDDKRSTILKHDYCSSKIRAALQILQPYFKASNPSSSRNGCASQMSKPNKVIVFSQWTSMLDLVEDWLGDNVEYRRLDGTMSLALRDEAVRDFNTKPEVTLMLMSLKAGNLGLNMVAANHVMLLDPWWNPTTEDQAIDRAHRIGQTRPVTVSRLIMRNTVEERITTLQGKKRRMIASALGEDPSGSFRTRLTIKDLRSLFNVG